jgi:thiamine biosynthesis lipoprotein
MRQVEVMGTVVVIDVFADGDAPCSEISRLVDEATRSLHEADEIFSTWMPNSPMSRLRRGEIGIEQVPPEVIEVLDQCAVAKELSLGWFDPWALPGGVDPTGYVKGWAAQRALRVLAKPQVRGAIVNAAGDIASFGGLSGAGGGQRFRFGIVDPFARRQILCVVSGADALATSGTYERGLHLVDPHTGSRVTRVASASVSGPDLGLADALATALAIAGQRGFDMVSRIDGFEAMVVTLDGVMHRTAGFPLVSSSSPTSVRTS